MSEELSRVKSRQNRNKRVGQSPTKEKDISQRTAHPARKERALPGSSGSTGDLSRQRRRSPSSSGNPGSSGEGEESTPSRAETYSSDRVRLSKMFVNSLILVFVILLASLLWWGIEGAPPLKTLW